MTDAIMETESGTARDALELEVTDFGPIVEAGIDLRPLTVFVGPSNTGKSWLAILIYALHRFFSSDAAFTLPSYWRFGGRGRAEAPPAAVDALREFTTRRESADSASGFLPSPVVDWIRNGVDASGVALGREILRCFGIDEIRALVRKGRRSGARIVLRRRVPRASARFAHVLTLAAGAAEFRAALPGEMPIWIDAVNIHEIERYVRTLEAEEKGSERRELFVRRAMNAVGNLVVPYLVDPLHLPAYYLPADRTGVMHAHSVVVSALIGSAPTAGLRPAARTPMLSGVLADFLEQLIEIDRPWRSRRRRARDLGARIEEAILLGSVNVDRSEAIDYPRFTYRPAGWKDALPLMNASSMVSELAPVVLYLRHMVGPGNVLIIEEPESHLHPAMQVEFTRQLAALVRSGVRVIVTTHSEWLLEELANVVRRSGLPGATRKGGTDGDQVALRSDQVGAWLFEPKMRPRGSVVREIHLDDSGLYPSGFDDVADALHNDWAEISSRIENGP